MTTLVGLLLNPDLMPTVIAPYLHLFDLFALATVSSRVWRTWVMSARRAQRDKWQTALRIRERVARRFGWTQWGRWSNIMRQAMARVAYAHVFPRSPHDGSRKWWCMGGGCGGNTVSSNVLVLRNLCGWRYCIHCYEQCVGSLVVTGTDNMRQVHEEVHGTVAPTMLYTHENNVHMFRILHFDGGRHASYAILYKHILAYRVHI
jgi:hypothetical protein